jgi:hypothetical protein
VSCNRYTPAEVGTSEEHMNLLRIIFRSRSGTVTGQVNPPPVQFDPGARYTEAHSRCNRAQRKDGKRTFSHSHSERANWTGSYRGALSAPWSYACARVAVQALHITSTHTAAQRLRWFR